MTTKTHIPIFLALTTLVVMAVACSSVGGLSKNDLEATIEAQSTRLAAMDTQVISQEQTNHAQWEAISYLSTSMPSALDLVTPTPPGITITPTPWLDIEYPPETRTGYPEIDRVIDAFFSPNNQDRIDLVRLIEYPCTTEDGLGGPPKCEPGEEPGAEVQAFPVVYTEGVHACPENLGAVFDFPIRGLFAVYIVQETAIQPEIWPLGEFGIVFTTEHGGSPHTVTAHVRDGEIVRLDFNYEWPPFEHVQERSNPFILPPSTR